MLWGNHVEEVLRQAAKSTDNESLRTAAVQHAFQQLMTDSESEDPAVATGTTKFQDPAERFKGKSG